MLLCSNLANSLKNTYITAVLFNKTKCCCLFLTKSIGVLQFLSSLVSNKSFTAPSTRPQSLRHSKQSASRFEFRVSSFEFRPRTAENYLQSQHQVKGTYQMTQHISHITHFCTYSSKTVHGSCPCMSNVQEQQASLAVRHTHRQECQNNHLPLQCLQLCGSWQVHTHDFCVWQSFSFPNAPFDSAVLMKSLFVKSMCANLCFDPETNWTNDVSTLAGTPGT